MRAFFRIFRNKWLITIVGFIALAILVWFVGPLIAIADKVPLQSPMSRLVCILVLILIWALNLLRIQMKVNKANAQLTEGFGGAVVADQGEETQRSREEVESLKERFDEALQVLKKNSRSKGRPSIYELPWYIIIGPPGTGKTTALVNSGLQFPLAEKYGNEALRGVGGTRNCDWWFTDDAVLLDTAGRYTTQDSHGEADKAAWEGFLQLLVRHRKRRPINGALVAISVSDMLTQSPAERSAQISAIKHRLEELNKELKASFPVYVLITKCDLIPGFTEFFDDLGREERGQVWGMTFPYSGTAEADVIERFGPEFDALVERLNVRVVTRMEQERDVERRSRIFTFPQQFDSLKEMLEEFLGEIFRGNRYQSDTLLRGIYFTSGTQEGNPIDRVLGSLSRTLGVSAQVAGREVGQGRSYFVTRLFKDLVFPEAGLAGANRRLEIQRFWVQRGAYAAAVLVTAIAVLAWTTSYTRNQVYVNRADSALEEYEVVRAQDLPGGAGFTEILEPLNASRMVAEVYEPFREDVPFLMGMGLYQGKRITRAADEAYRVELQRLLLTAIAARLERHLVIGEKDPDFQYQALKTYLMLGNAERLEDDVVRGWMELDWGITFERQPEIQGQLQSHLDATLAMGFEPLALDDVLVERARTNLKLQSAAQLLYGMIKRDYLATDTAPLTLIDIYGTSGSSVFEQVGAGPERQIPSLFTYEGYHDYFSKNLGELVALAEREAWVLDDKPRVLSLPEKNQLRKDLRGLYFDDYKRTWKRMLGSLKVVPFESDAQAASVLNIASSTNSPIRRVLEVTARNTSLADKATAEMLGKAGELGAKAASRTRIGRLFDSVSDQPATAQAKVTVPEQVIDDEFEPLNKVTLPDAAGAPPLDSILNILSQLYGQFDAISGGFGQDAVSLVKSEILKRLKRTAAQQPEPLQGWLLGIVSNSRSIGQRLVRDKINREWQASVYPTCRAALNGRYPFQEGADREVTLADFGRLFGPGGTIDTFYNQQILPFTEVRGGRRQWKTVDGMGMMSDSSLRLFQRAAAIKGMFFQAGGNRPSIAFKMKPVYLDANVDSVSIDLEGQDFTYRHGPQFQQSAQWPYPDSNGVVRLEFVDDSGNTLVRKFEGPWAWFRLLGESEITSKTGDIALVTFEHRGRRASWELHAQSVENPFLMSQLSRFHCPERL